MTNQAIFNDLKSRIDKNVYEIGMVDIKTSLDYKRYYSSFPFDSIPFMKVLCSTSI